MTVVDAHHHLWDPDVGEYPWMTGEFAALRRRYDLADLRPLLAADGVTATIVVQVRADVAETIELLETSARSPEIVGVVGWADLTSPRVAERIAALRSGPGGANLVGLRHAVADEPDARWLLREDVDAALTVVASSGLTFDLEITTRELAVADIVARRHPDLRLVVDHAAKPPIAAGWSTEWADGLAALAANANVSCKLSGLVTEASWTGWTEADLRPYVDHAIAVFGTDRVMFGSDWPVCELAASYHRVITTTRRALTTLTDKERRNVMSCNALNVYRPAKAIQDEVR